MGNTYVAVHALIEDRGKVLVLKRAENDDYKPGLWDLPGGAVEFGETAESALQRELFEETGLIVENNGIIFFHTNNSQVPERQTFQAVYRCKIKGSASITLNCEHSEYRWETMDNLRNYNCMCFLQELLRNCNMLYMKNE